MQISLFLAPPRLHRVYNVGRWSTFTKDLINACIASLRLEIFKQFALHRLKMYFLTRAHDGRRLSKSLSSASGFPFLYGGSRVDEAVFLLVTPPWRVGKGLRTIPHQSLRSKFSRKVSHVYSASFSRILSTHFLDIKAFAQHGMLYHTLDW
jgi:hypothetical protein